MADSDRIVREVAAAVGLAEGEPGVRSVIAALARLEPVSIRRISRTVDLPVPIVASVCGELRKQSVVSERRPAQLTHEGRTLFAAGQLGVRRAAACPTCAGRGLVVPGELSALAAELTRIARNVPRPKLELDQCHCTIGTKIRRVLALDEADALVGRRVLLLGDDDLLSVTIDAVVRRLGSASTIARLTVVDVDDELLLFLRGHLEAAPFPASCVAHDLREPLAPELRAAFDTVVTDPPYTVPAARLFLSRAVEALDGPGGRVFFAFGSKRPGASFEVQRAVGEMGFVIRRLVPDFNDYVGAGALGGTSQLYHLVATNDVRPLVTGRFDGPLYTAD
ncbi:MAG: bis-aminopropyl spermidine synthase family protein [Gaiellaceae bacterium]